MAVLVNTLMDAMVARLTAKLITEIDRDDVTYTKLVRGGLLQDDPTKYKILVLVHVCDPQDDAWKHEVVQDDEAAQILKRQVWEMGGPHATHLEWLRFTVELQCFLKGRTGRDTQRVTANTVAFRARHALMTMDVPSGQDEFGQSAIQIVVANIFLREGGGEPAEFIWRGRMQVQWLTEMEYV